MYVSVSSASEVADTAATFAAAVALSSGEDRGSSPRSPCLQENCCFSVVVFGKTTIYRHKLIMLSRFVLTARLMRL